MDESQLFINSLLLAIAVMISRHNDITANINDDSTITVTKNEVTYTITIHQGIK